MDFTYIATWPSVARTGIGPRWQASSLTPYSFSPSAVVNSGSSCLAYGQARAVIDRSS